MSLAGLEGGGEKVGWNVLCRSESAAQRDEIDYPLYSPSFTYRDPLPRELPSEYCLPYENGFVICAGKSRSTAVLEVRESSVHLHSPSRGGYQRTEGEVNKEKGPEKIDEG